MNPPETCTDERRRRSLRNRGDGPPLNGIDDVDVLYDWPAPPPRGTTITLVVTFLNKTPLLIETANVRVDGGRRPGSKAVVVEVRPEPSADPSVADRLEVDIRPERRFDLSDYSLSIVKTDSHGRPGTEPLDGLDPRYASVVFSFTADCPSDLDCLPDTTCPPALLTSRNSLTSIKTTADFASSHSIACRFSSPTGPNCLLDSNRSRTRPTWESRLSSCSPTWPII